MLKRLHSPVLLSYYIKWSLFRFKTFSYWPLVHAWTTCHFQQNETDKISLCGELLYLDRMVLIFIPRGVSKDRIYMVFSFKTFKNVYTFVVEDYLWVIGNYLGPYISLFQQLDSKDFSLFGGVIKFHSHARGVPIMVGIYVTITTITMILGWRVWRLYKPKSETKTIARQKTKKKKIQKKKTTKNKRTKNNNKKTKNKETKTRQPTGTK